MPDEHRWTRAVFTPEGLGPAPGKAALGANIIIPLDGGLEKERLQVQRQSAALQHLKASLTEKIRSEESCSDCRLDSTLFFKCVSCQAESAMASKFSRFSF